MKPIKSVIFVLIVIILIPLLGFTGWLLKDSTPLNILTINKSMRKFNGSENQSLNYLLNKEKIFTDWNQKYNLKDDFYGMHWMNKDFWIQNIKLKEVEEKTINSDLVYFADIYGVRTSHLRDLKENEKDKLEYGGINNTDYAFIRSLLSHNKYTIVESSFICPPTEPLVRYNLEKLTDIYYAGWKGKYLGDLSIDSDCNSELNCKILYETYTGNKWDASGPGIIFYNAESQRIIVLLEGIDINTSNGLIRTSEEGIEKFNLPERVNYKGQFTVLHPGRNKVISTFQLNPTDEGRKKLNEGGIPASFPALIETDNHLYYLAGDFGKSNVNMFFSRIAGVNSLLQGTKKRSINANNFYYSYYYPFMNTILNDVKNSRGQNEDN